jgi:hypothetical protein
MSKPPLTFSWSTNEILKEGIIKVNRVFNGVIVEGKKGEEGKGHFF